jgi:predicted nuclease of restriction endonuclease-like (RecB) superfamily
MQIPGVDYSESFEPVASDKKSNWDLEMFYVEAAFFNADLDKQVFIEWPQGMLDLRFYH